MNGIFCFIASPAGRILRIIAGFGLIAWGTAGLGGSTGYWLATAGILPILTGAFNICLFAPLLGQPLKGSGIHTAAR